MFILVSKIHSRARRFYHEDWFIAKELRNNAKEQNLARPFAFNNLEFHSQLMPTIPSKTLKSNSNVDFITKLRETGETIKVVFQNSSEKINASRVDSKSRIGKFDLGQMKNDSLLFAFRNPNIQNLTSGQNRNPFNKLVEGMRKVQLNRLKTVGTDDSKDSNDEQESSTISIVKSDAPVDKIKAPPSLRIIMPDENNEKVAANDTMLGDDNQLKDSGIENEQNVDVNELSGSGVRDAENFFIPERGLGELVVLHVGVGQRKRILYAISRKRTPAIKGNVVIEVSVN
jgi:hypothetical protein